MKFKVGMKVRVMEDQEEYEIKGLVGKVVKEYYDWGDGGFWGVEFPSSQFSEGHCLDGALAPRATNGLWVETDKLKPLNLVLENK